MREPRGGRTGRRWPTTIRRPTAMPAQYSDRARVAVVSGAGSRNRTSQFDTPTSAPRRRRWRSPRSSSGAGEQPPSVRRSPTGARVVGRSARRGRAGRSASGRRRRRRPAISDEPRPATSTTVCHGTPPSTSRPTTSGADERPEAEEQVEQVHRPAAALAVDVEDEAVRAAIQAARPERRGHRRQRRTAAQTAPGPGRRCPTPWSRTPPAEHERGDRPARSAARRRTTRPRTRRRTRDRPARCRRRSGRTWP